MPGTRRLLPRFIALLSLLLLASPAGTVVPVLIAGSLLSLSVLGALAARAGGAGLLKGALRVTLWSALAMALTLAVGSAFGALS